MLHDIGQQDGSLWRYPEAIGDDADVFLQGLFHAFGKTGLLDGLEDSVHAGGKSGELDIALKKVLLGRFSSSHSFVCLHYILPRNLVFLSQNR